MPIKRYHIVKGHGSVRTHQSNAESQGDFAEIAPSHSFRSCGA